jgi:steroid Delta-isomerase
MTERPLREVLSASLDSFDIHHREPFLEDLRAHYADDVFFRDPMQQARGLEAFLALNRRMGKGAKSIRFSTRDSTGDDELFYLYWEMTFTPRLGPTLTLEGVSRLRARDRRIYEHLDFWDIGGLLASGIPGGQRILRALFLPFV